MQIRELQRGGQNVFGGAWYDARRRRVIMLAHEDDVELVEWTLPSTVSSVAIETEDSMDTTTPAISDTQVSFTLSAIGQGGVVELLATLASGAKTRLIIEASRPSGWNRDYA